MLYARYNRRCGVSFLVAGSGKLPVGKRPLLAGRLYRPILIVPQDNGAEVLAEVGREPPRPKPSGNACEAARADWLAHAQGEQS
jgi:hypothetical protein